MSPIVHLTDNALAKRATEVNLGQTRIFMFSRFFIVCVSIVVVVSGATATDAQTKKTKTPAKKPVAAASEPAKTESKIEQPLVVVSGKKNERPGSGITTPSASATTVSTAQKTEPAYRYEFTQPDFINSRIIIEHDEKGVGKISFARRGGDELFTDPLTVSESALKRLNEHFTALNFLDSAENYQYEKDYSHLGNIKITLNRAAKARLAAFNYTLNKNAKGLADEYRAIANQAIWVFDITIARENQPLESPNQMKGLESLIKRNEISDPEQLLPFLRELADDERLPLIARNHATRIVTQIEKTSKKAK